MNELVLFCCNELGLLRDRGAFQIQFVHAHVWDDLPVLAAVKNHATGKVVEFTGCTPAEVAVIEFRPAYVAAALLRARAGNPFTPELPPFAARLGAVVAIAPLDPPEADRSARLTVVPDPPPQET